MKDRRLLWVVLTVAGLLVGWLVFRQTQESSKSEGRSAPPTHVNEQAQQGQHPNQSATISPNVANNAGTANPAAPSRPSGTAKPMAGAVAGALSTPVTDSNAAPTPPDSKIEVEKVRLMIRSYHNVMGENPVGTNAEIMQALMGQNPKQAQLGPPEGQSLNEKGELVDQWGTPFFFHQLSKDVMEIRSAGPDKIMGTADDSVSR